MKTYTLQQRADFYNQQFSHLQPPNVPCYVKHGTNGRSMLSSFWFMGGGTGNVSNFYGSYQTEYLIRVGAMFPDCRGKTKALHLFSGSLPPSNEYSRVGQDPTGQYTSDYNLDAHQLSSFLPFKPELIYADPPYSIEDSSHYQNSMVDRTRIIEECGLVLQPGGYVVWLDQALPVFSNKLLELVGAIGYIRSTGNRFRMISIFRRRINV